MDCNALSELFPHRVFFPDNPAYVQSTSSYFAAFENEVHPTYVITPSSVEELSRIIIAVHRPALEGKFQIAIRAGGHTPWAGAANVENGITIDLQNIRGVEVNTKTKVCSVGSGERWSNVYSTLGSQNLAVAGGRVSKVGVAGLTTGGGLSYFSAAVGFVCDNVINYEVVLASGEIVQANAQTNPDLFIALKGGSNNFGIVTRFDFATFPQAQMWGGAIFYDASAVPRIIEAFNEFAAAIPGDEEAHLIAGTSFTAGNENGVTNIYHSTPVVAPPLLKPFTEIPGQVYSSLREDSLLGFADEQSAFSQDGARQLYFTTCFRLDVAFILRDVGLTETGGSV